MDASGNDFYKDNSRIVSYYSFDFKNKDETIYENEIDILGTFADENNNVFISKVTLTIFHLLS